MTTASPAPAGLTVRTITEQELELFFALPLDYDDGALRAPTTLDSFTTEWRRGSRRPGWTWLALRHGRPVARAAWWAPSESAHPAILDIFDLGAEPDRLAVGEALLRACWREAGSDGARDLEYELFLPPGWRGDPAAREPAERRLEVARRAGLAVPGGNDNGHIVAYLGVVPEQRGHGYAGELLAEATAFLAEQGTARIRADTDVANTPMAAAFERAGYDQFAIRIDLVARPVT